MLPSMIFDLEQLKAKRQKVFRVTLVLSSGKQIKKRRPFMAPGTAQGLNPTFRLSLLRHD
jgi:hypothetical protein